MGQTREEVDGLGSTPPQQTRSKVDFADLCGSLEDLVYIGEGSNGIVYSASWHGARVAVKFLLGNSDDSAHRQRCFTEAILTRVLSHPCVVQCFATAIAQLTPEVWEAIRARCRRHQSLLQSSSFGRSVATAVLQQQEQDLLQDLLLEPLEPQPHLPPQLMAHLGSLRRAARQQQQHYQGPTQQPSPLSSVHQQQQLHQRPSPPQQPRRASSSAQHVLAERSQSNPLTLLAQAGRVPRPDSAKDCIPGPGGKVVNPYRPLSGMRKIENLFVEEDPAGLGGDAEGEGEGEGMEEAELLALAGAAGGDATPGNRSSMERMFDAGPQPSGASGEGISLLQALVDLKAETGRHCTVVVMEYMDAGTLHHSIVRGDFSARRSQEHRVKLLSLLLTAQELAQGMAHLHALDILHGDLKPTNVLLKATPCQYSANAGAQTGSATAPTCTDPRGYAVKIADLGLARTCPGETASLSSDQWGALAYLAPEAAKGSCCKASDVYSFGVMLWEMAAGVRPYLGLTTPQVLMGLVTGTLQLTWPADGSLYAPLRSLAIACTDYNPAERPTFEVAARILGRMVRHIRTASEPLRQRHSSALSMETGGSGTPAGAGNGKWVLSHASRSMPLYLPNSHPAAHAAAAAVASGGGGVSGSGSGSTAPGAAVAAAVGAAASAATMSRAMTGPPSASPLLPWTMESWTAKAAHPAAAGGGAGQLRSGTGYLPCGGGGGGGGGAVQPRSVTGSLPSGGGGGGGVGGHRPPSRGWASCQPVRIAGVASPSGALGLGLGAGPRKVLTCELAGSPPGANSSCGIMVGVGAGTSQEISSSGGVTPCTHAAQQLAAALVAQHPANAHAPWAAAAAPPAAQAHFPCNPSSVPPRMRRGVGGHLCGAPVRSPLGTSASLRVIPSTTQAGREAVWVPVPLQAPVTVRPGSSPAHAHIT